MLLKREKDFGYENLIYVTWWPLSETLRIFYGREHEWCSGLLFSYNEWKVYFYRTECFWSSKNYLLKSKSGLEAVCGGRAPKEVIKVKWIIKVKWGPDLTGLVSCSSAWREHGGRFLLFSHGNTCHAFPGNGGMRILLRSTQSPYRTSTGESK